MDERGQFDLSEFNVYLTTRTNVLLPLLLAVFILYYVTPDGSTKTTKHRFVLSLIQSLTAAFIASWL